MSFKDFWQNNVIAFILKRIVLAIVLIIAIAWSSLILIDFYTNHGESVPVPDLQGLYIEEAENLLENNDLYAQIIDSVYVREKPLGTIVEQIPAANSSVKKNRLVFLIVNQRIERTVPLPELNDISLRQADALLKSLNLKVSAVQYKPSEFKDLVIDVMKNGRSIPTGTRLPEGASVELVVGSGLGENLSRVPSLIGLSINDARSQAMNMSFILGSQNFDVTPNGNESKFVIYKQMPVPGEYMSEGTRINIWLTKDKNTVQKSVDEQVKVEQDEEFF